MRVLMATTMSMVAVHMDTVTLQLPRRRTMHTAMATRNTAMATRNTARPFVATAMAQVIRSMVLGMATIRSIHVQATHMKTMVTGIVWKKQFYRIWSLGA